MVIVRGVVGGCRMNEEPALPGLFMYYPKAGHELIKLRDTPYRSICQEVFLALLSSAVHGHNLAYHQIREVNRKYISEYVRLCA